MQVGSFIFFVTVGGSAQTFMVDVPPEAFNLTETGGLLSGLQTLNLRSIHENDAHYIVASQFELVLNFASEPTASGQIVLVSGMRAIMKMITPLIPAPSRRLKGMPNMPFSSLLRTCDLISATNREAQYRCNVPGSPGTIPLLKRTK